MKPFILILIIFFTVRYLRKRISSGASDKGRASVKGAAGRTAAGKHEARQSQRRDSGADEEMVLDPACKSYVPISSAVRLDIDNRTEYFCSAECAGRYASSKGTPSEN